MEAPRYAGSIAFADAGGVSLAEVAKPRSVNDLIGLAEGLTLAMPGMHRRA
jgi:hypothetical protein